MKSVNAEGVNKCVGKIEFSFLFIFMEDYKTYLYGQIFELLGIVHSLEDCNSDVLHQVVKHNRDNVYNYKDELLHSEYLEDRYKPAIILYRSGYAIAYVYLFDGEIRDCVHPCIIHRDRIEYYSSERIEQDEPIHIGIFYVTQYPIISMGQFRVRYTSTFPNSIKYNLYGDGPDIRTINTEYPSYIKKDSCTELFPKPWHKYAIHEPLKTDPVYFKFAD